MADYSKPAFPPNLSSPESGMTLREWYAGMAMQGLIARGDHDIHKVKGVGSLAKHAFEFADAMIK
jgi:hypothetical protein